jgi:hypothetical protein
MSLYKFHLKKYFKKQYKLYFKTLPSPSKCLIIKGILLRKLFIICCEIYFVGVDVVELE